MPNHHIKCIYNFLQYFLFIFCRSEIVWEQKKKSRWKTLPGKMCDALEEGYLKTQGRKNISKEKILEMEVSMVDNFLLL